MKHLDCSKFLSIDHTFSTLKSREFRVVRVRSISQHLHSIVNEKQTGRFIKQMKRGHFIYRVSWYNDISIGHLCIPLIKTAIQIVDSQSTNFNQSWTWPKKKKKKNVGTTPRHVLDSRPWTTTGSGISTMLFFVESTLFADCLSANVLQPSPCWNYPLSSASCFSNNKPSYAFLFRPMDIEMLLQLMTLV